jgi:hypothetical protein
VFFTDNRTEHGRREGIEGRLNYWCKKNEAEKEKEEREGKREKE